MDQPPAGGSSESEELSGRAKFRATPIDPAVTKKIYDMRLTAPMGAAMRNAMRSNADEIREEKQFKGFSRGPLYRDIPEPVMEMIGSTRKDKLTFIAGALALDSMPPPLLPEVAFCGRSNVGKSSLINAVTLSTTVRSSDKPGMTQQFNFFVLPRRLMLADLPGYGFAFANPHKMETWKLLMDQYMQQRKSLKRVYVLLDARHGLKVSDIEFMDRLEVSKTSFQVIITKTDLVSAEDLARRHTLIMDKLNLYSKAIKTVRMVSAYTGAGLIEVAMDLYRLSAKETDEAPKKAQAGSGEQVPAAQGPAAGAPTPKAADEAPKRAQAGSGGQGQAAGAPSPRTARVVGGGRGREDGDERVKGRGEGAERPKRAGLGGKGGKYEGKWGQ